MTSDIIKVSILSEDVLTDLQDLHDFRIKTDDGEVSCCKYNICARSPVIRGKITLKKYHQTKTLTMEGYKSAEIQMVITLVETGSLTITDAGVKDYFMSVLESLQIAILEETVHQDLLKTENEGSPMTEGTQVKIDYEGLTKYKDSSQVLCEPCGKDFSSMHTAKRHFREKHGPGGDPIECHLCGKIYKSKLSHGDHLRKKHNIRVSRLEKKMSKPNARIKKE